jgi:hypothetical protein
MDYLIFVEVFDGYDKIGEEEICLDLREYASAHASDMIAEISGVDLVHDVIDVLLVLKSIGDIDEKGCLLRDKRFLIILN